METKTNYLLLFLKWAGTTVEDDKGKVSIKRITVIVLVLTAAYVIIHNCRNQPVTFDWTSTCLLLTTIFGVITLLLGIGAKEKQDILKNAPSVIADAKADLPQ